MKSTIVLKLLLVLCMLFVVFPSTALAADSPPVIPEEIGLLLGGAVTFFVVSGLKDFLKFTGHDLTGWSTVIAVAITATLVFSIDQAVSVIVAINPDAASLIEMLYKVLIIVASSMGYKRAVRGEANNAPRELPRGSI